jgi:FAD/FMN-containing dehydrogenase
VGTGSARRWLTDGWGKRAVVWRNFEASLDTASLEPRTRAISTYLLQEYFIPAERFLPFARDMARILSLRGVNALNVSIRHSPADPETLLTWAPTAVFSFVLYYKQRTSDRASAVTQVWTRELIEAALHHGGRYYLPYRLDATTEQFVRAYPEARTFMTLKARIDPDRRFRNRLWDKYLLPPGTGHSL